MVDIALPGVAYAEVHRGMWIARCPQPYCDNAVALPLGAPMMRCHGDRDCCERESPVMWPRDPVAIATVLAARPVPKTRNWLPHETIHDLLDENAQHGLLPDAWQEIGGVLAKTTEGVVVDGLLAEALPAASERLMIGGR